MQQLMHHRPFPLFRAAGQFLGLTSASLVTHGTQWFAPHATIDADLTFSTLFVHFPAKPV